MKIAILLTTYNRKNTTMNCINSIYEQDLIQFGYYVDIYITDDNSEDGTFEEIKKNYPEIYIYRSKGNLYWGRGMLYSWQKAIERDRYDAFIWVNDDNIFFKNAFVELFDCAKKTQWNSIICGCFKSKENKFTYGGYDKNHKPIYPNGYLQSITYMNGNFVLIPQSIVDRIGLLDWHFHHIGGDFDYGITAQKHAFTIYSTTCYIGISERNPKGDNRGRNLGRSLKERFYDLYNCPFIENPQQKWYENRKHGRSFIRCILIFIKMHLITILPDSFYDKIRQINKYRNESFKEK